MADIDPGLAAPVPADHGLAEQRDYAPLTAADVPMMRPRVAYRLARGWDYQQVIAAYDAAAAALGAEHPELTPRLLEAYEDWPYGGAQPSALTLRVLARAYGAAPRDLLDQADRDHLPAAEMAALDAGPVRSRPDGGGSNGSSLAESLVAQATAALAFAAAVIYAAGGLMLALQLWFLKVSWTPVLGQLPRDFLGVTAFGQVVLPAVLVGGIAGSLIDWLTGLGSVEYQGSKLVKSYWGQTGAAFWFATLGVAAVIGALLGLVPLGVLFFTQHAAAGALRSWPAIFLCCAVISGVVWFFALYALRRVYVRASQGKPRRLKVPLRRTLIVAVASFALIPCFASIGGAFLLPPVAICGPKFMHPVKGTSTEQAGYLRGNLIGSNSQWVYVAQFNYAGNVIVGRSITVIPASSVELQAIGRGAGCGDLPEIRS